MVKQETRFPLCNWSNQWAAEFLGVTKHNRFKITINNLPVELWSTDHEILNVIAKHGERRLSAGISKSCNHAVKILRDGNSYDVKIIIDY